MEVLSECDDELYAQQRQKSLLIEITYIGLWLNEVFDTSKATCSTLSSVPMSTSINRVYV